MQSVPVHLPSRDLGAKGGNVNGHLDIETDLSRRRRAPCRGRARRRRTPSGSTGPSRHANVVPDFVRAFDHGLLAGDVQRLHRLRWVVETSMLKTLARKHRSSVSKMATKHKAKVVTPYGPRTCFEASIVRDGRKPLVARFGGIALKRQKQLSSPTVNRTSTAPAALSPQGADQAAAEGEMRVMRASG